MRIAKTGLQFVLAWVALIAAQVIAGLFVSIKVPPAPHAHQWALVSDTLIVLALGYAALRSDWHGWRLFAALLGIPLAINLADTLEAVVFLGNVKMDWKALAAWWTVQSVVAAAAWVAIFRRRTISGATRQIGSHSAARNVGLFALCSLLYVVCYFTAGTIIFPFVRDYYATQTVPPMLEIVLLQFFVRGPVFVVICIVLTRMLRLPRLPGAIAVGLVFTELSGIAPLLVPNPILPDLVRWVHLGEVTTSNFVVAAGVAWLWGAQQVADAERLREQRRTKSTQERDRPDESVELT